MLPHALAILLASLLGSLHCAGMCGPFVAIAAGDGPSLFRRQLAYHLGRLTTYVLMGLAAGALGQLADVAAALAGVQPVAVALAGATLVVFGLAALARHAGLRLAPVQPPKAWTALITSATRAAIDRPPIARAAILGLVTTLLPCGWLYLFAVTAAGSGSPLRGAAVMAIFWLGTLPVLVALGASLHQITPRLGRAAPVVTACLLVAVGAYTLFNRGRLDPDRLFHRVQAALPVAAAQAAVPDPSTPPPCCQPAPPAPVPAATPPCCCAHESAPTSAPAAAP